jgi:hypothetical protein
MKKEKLQILRLNWKLGAHLIFRTKRFGVNNEWWSSFDSIFGWPWWKQVWALLTIKPLFDNYQAMKFRAVACKFVSEETAGILFGKR